WLARYPARRQIRRVAFGDFGEFGAVGTHRSQVCKAVRMKHRTNHQILPRAGTRTGKPAVRTMEEARLHLAGILESEESRDLIRFQRIQQLTRLPASGKSGNSNPHPACIAILRAPEHSSGHELSAGPLRLPSMPLLKLERPFAHVPSES